MACTQNPSPLLPPPPATFIHTRSSLLPSAVRTHPHLHPRYGRRVPRLLRLRFPTPHPLLTAVLVGCEGEGGRRGGAKGRAMVAQECTGCRARFGPLKREHRCRRCGGGFCGTCARVRRGPAAGGAASRVCAVCVREAKGDEVQELLRWAGFCGAEKDGCALIRDFNKSLPGAAVAASAAADAGAAGGAAEAAASSDTAAGLCQHPLYATLLGTIATSIDPALGKLPPHMLPTYFSRLAMFLSSHQEPHDLLRGDLA